MKKKLFVISLIVILGFPVYLVGSWVYGNRQIVAKAEQYFKEIPEYPNVISSSKENAHSIYSLGYAKGYSTNDSWENVKSFYESSIPNYWKLGDLKLSRGLVYENQNDRFSLVIDFSEGDEVNSFIVSISEPAK